MSLALNHSTAYYQHWSSRRSFSRRRASDRPGLLLSCTFLQATLGRGSRTPYALREAKEFLASYGGYLGQELQKICTDLMVAAIDARSEVREAAVVQEVFRGHACQCMDCQPDVKQKLYKMVKSEVLAAQSVQITKEARTRRIEEVKAKAMSEIRKYLPRYQRMCQYWIDTQKARYARQERRISRYTTTTEHAWLVPRLAEDSLREGQSLNNSASQSYGVFQLISQKRGKRVPISRIPFNAAPGPK